MSNNGNERTAMSNNKGVNIINIRYRELWQFYCDSFGIDQNETRFTIILGDQAYEMVKRIKEDQITQGDKI